MCALLLICDPYALRNSFNILKLLYVVIFLTLSTFIPNRTDGNCFSVGSGSVYAYGVLDNGYRYDLVILVITSLCVFSKVL